MRDLKTKEQKSLSKRLYRNAKRLGLKLQLCRRGSEAGTYRLVDRETNMVLHAARPDGYGLTLQKVDERLHMVRERLDLEKAEETPYAALSTQGPGGGIAEPSLSHSTKRRKLNPELLAEKYVSDPVGNAQEDVRIADAKIPSYIRNIFELMKLWAMSEIEGSPARRPTLAELEGMGHYLETWKAVAKCTADQMRLYIFAHILRATIIAEKRNEAR